MGQFLVRLHEQQTNNYDAMRFRSTALIVQASLTSNITNELLLLHCQPRKIS